MLICRFWLADCYAEMGRLVKARQPFERRPPYADDGGLDAEGLDVATGRPLGTFPRASTRVAPINAVISLVRAEAASRTLVAPGR